MSHVYGISNPDPRRAPDLAPRPTFGLWDAIFFADRPGMSLGEADTVVFGHWDDYADHAIRILHDAIRQTEALVFSNDEYTDLVRTFHAFPHRPSLSAVLRDNVYDEHRCAVTALADLTQTPVQRLWHQWATRVEEIHHDLAGKMGRCRLRFAKQDEDDFGLAQLALSSDLPRAESLTGLLHKILDSASEPDEESEDARTGLEGRMQLMGF